MSIKYDTDRFGSNRNADAYIKACTTDSMECMCAWNDLFGDGMSDPLCVMHSQHASQCPNFQKPTPTKADTATTTSLEGKVKSTDKSIPAKGAEVTSNSEGDDMNIKTTSTDSSPSATQTPKVEDVKSVNAGKSSETKGTNSTTNGAAISIPSKPSLKGKAGASVVTSTAANTDETNVEGTTALYHYPESFKAMLHGIDWEALHRHHYGDDVLSSRIYSVQLSDIGRHVHLYLPYDHLWYEGQIVEVRSTYCCDLKFVHDGAVITIYPNELLLIRMHKVGSIESSPSHTDQKSETSSGRISRRRLRGKRRRSSTLNTHSESDSVQSIDISSCSDSAVINGTGYRRRGDDGVILKECKCCCPSMMAHELPSRLQDISHIDNWQAMGRIPRNVINSFVSMNMTVFEDDYFFESGKQFSEYSGEASHSKRDSTLVNKSLEDSNDTVEWLADMIIKAPIRQNLYQSPDAKCGVYHCVNVIEHERMSVRYFLQKTQRELAKEVKESKKVRQIMQWIQRNEIEPHIEQIQREWIRNLTYRHPLYGADSVGSLFHPEQVWNMANLDTILNLIPTEIQGVTIPYLYFGSWRSMFAWHIEDRALWALNYLHFGRPKVWFGVPPADASKMEQLMASHFPKDAAYCKVFTRHKSSFVDPKVLEKNGVTVYRAIQRANEIVISAPKYVNLCCFVRTVLDSRELCGVIFIFLLPSDSIVYAVRTIAASIWASTVRRR